MIWQKNPATRKRLAFTLVELLVVIAIIVILAALAFPITTSMIETGNSSKCVANQKQIVTGIIQFAQENNGLPSYICNGPWYWNARLSRATGASPPPTLPYMPYHPNSSTTNAKGSLTIWICPANNPFKKSPNRETSYGIINTIYPNNESNSSPVPLLKLDKPSKTIALGDCSLTSSSAARIGSDADIAKVHKGGANFAFFDGHVEFFKDVPAYTNGMFKRTGGN
jgi:prepilin-type processing-associated H-X9-DG protein/prepilin-type N-terminal cleavage/methylation domain-containing protein